VFKGLNIAGKNFIRPSSDSSECVCVCFMGYHIQVLNSADPPPPELVQHGHTSQPFYSDVRVMVPLIVAIFALIGAATAAGLCWRHSKYLGPLQKLTGCSRRDVTFLVEFIDVPTLVAEQPRPLKESLDNQQNAQTQRERYYATIHKVALQAGSDKIPGNAL